MSRAGKQAVNLTLSSEVLAAARRHEINLSATLEKAVARELKEIDRRKWLERNAPAMEAYNEDVEAHGSFADTLRGF